MFVALFQLLLSYLLKRKKTEAPSQTREMQVFLPMSPKRDYQRQSAKSKKMLRDQITEQRRTSCSRITARRNKPGTAKVGAISKAQNLKGGPFGLCETPAGCKKFKKNLKGGPFGDMKKFPKNFFNEIFEQCHSAKKCKKGDTLRFFDIHCVAKHQKN